MNIQWIMHFVAEVTMFLSKAITLTDLHIIYVSLANYPLCILIVY
jgi:hypothetical protein